MLNYRPLLKADKSFIGREARAGLVCVRLQCADKESTGEYCIAFNSSESGWSCKGVSLQCHSFRRCSGQEMPPQLNNETRLGLSNSSWQTEDVRFHSGPSDEGKTE